MSKFHVQDFCKCRRVATWLKPLSLAPYPRAPLQANEYDNGFGDRTLNDDGDELMNIKLAEVGAARLAAAGAQRAAIRERRQLVP